MQVESRQSGEKVTESLRGQFHVTRLRLTFLYAALLTVILCFSSIVLYSTFTRRLDFHIQEQRLRRGLPFSPFQEELPGQARDDLLVSIIIVNGFLLAGSVALSYGLAGITLLPVQEAFDRQRRFLSDASHELRTPLTILQTDLENELADKAVKGGARERALSHLEEVGRMGGLVKDLLLLSRLDAHEGLVEKIETVEMGACVGTAVERLQSYAHKQAIHLSYVQSNEEFMLQANKEHLVQAISNIIKNAIDYNTKDGSVRVEVVTNNRKTEIKIIDTGVGIPESEVSKLFDRFYRVDKSRSRQAGGSGLGLSIVQSIVATYGGSISVSSKEGVGTTVCLTWPR